MYRVDDVCGDEEGIRARKKVDWCVLSEFTQSHMVLK